MKKLSYFFTILCALCFSTALFAETPNEAPPPPDQGLMQMVIMIGLALLFFYFILFRPEQKRRKEMEEQRAGLKKGDRVTAMGIIGTVDKILDQTIIVRMVDGSKIEFLKGAITEVLPRTEPDLKIEKDENSKI